MCSSKPMEKCFEQVADTGASAVGTLLHFFLMRKKLWQEALQLLKASWNISKKWMGDGPMQEVFNVVRDFVCCFSAMTRQPSGGVLATCRSLRVLLSFLRGLEHTGWNLFFATVEVQWCADIGSFISNEPVTPEERLFQQLLPLLGPTAYEPGEDLGSAQDAVALNCTISACGAALKWEQAEASG